jgi:cobalt/nickel transport system permease protein
MHMADALISPEVGGAMWVASAGAIVFCSHKVKQTLDDFKVPLMGVMGAFIFAAQMINFSIPGTGSSGHICGSLLLSVVLGPYAALLVIASVLLVQALIFADGGLVALGCNIFNMGVIPCLIAYPLIYRTIAGTQPSRFRLWAGSIVASVIGLQIGAFAVVLETCFSGISELPFTGFILMMLPIHLAIGFIEGIITASVLTLIQNSRPELISGIKIESSPEKHPLRGIIIATLSAALVIGGIFSWFASEKPDGLEWAIAGVTNGVELESPSAPAHSTAEKIQEASSILPDYGFKSEVESNTGKESTWGSVNSGTSVSGIAGAIITLILAFVIGILFKHKFNRHKCNA